MTKCNVDKLRAGDRVSRLSYCTVTDIAGPKVTVKNETGREWSIGKEIFEDEFFTPDQFGETVELTRTEMIEIIRTNTRIIMTVNFHKKADNRALLRLVTGLLDDEHDQRKRHNKVQLTKLLKAAIQGEERTMIGRHEGQLDEFGRLQFMATEEKISGLRKVDPRTVQWAIIANVKYVLK